MWSLATRLELHTKCAVSLVDAGEVEGISLLPLASLPPCLLLLLPSLLFRLLLARPSLCFSELCRVRISGAGIGTIGTGPAVLVVAREVRVIARGGGGRDGVAVIESGEARLDGPYGRTRTAFTTLEEHHFNPALLEERGVPKVNEFGGHGRTPLGVTGRVNGRQLSGPGEGEILSRTRSAADNYTSHARETNLHKPDPILMIDIVRDKY